MKPVTGTITESSVRAEPVPLIRSIPENAFASVVAQVDAFQDTLLDHEEVGLSVNGADNVIHVASIFRKGQMFVFDGLDSQQRRTRLIQHYTQINLQLTVVSKLKDVAQRIGFHTDT